MTDTESNFAVISPRAWVAIDVGGEGRHEHAWNVNMAPVRTIGSDRGQPISRLVQARASQLPFAAASIDEVIVERTPLTRATLLEIGRVLRPGGRVVLRHVPLEDRDRHALACRLIAGEVTRGTGKIGGQEVIETVICVPVVE